MANKKQFIKLNTSPKLSRPVHLLPRELFIRPELEKNMRSESWSHFLNGFATIIKFAIVFGFISVCFLHAFNFQSFVEGLISESFVPFDISQYYISIRNMSVSNWPEWLQGIGYSIQGIAMAFGSIWYVISFMFKLFGYVVLGA